MCLSVLSHKVTSDKCFSLQMILEFKYFKGSEMLACDLMETMSRSSILCKYHHIDAGKGNKKKMCFSLHCFYLLFINFPLFSILSFLLFVFFFLLFLS